MSEPQTETAIETLFEEERRYPPPPEFVAQANAKPDIYDIPFEEFWEREGASAGDVVRAVHVASRVGGSVCQVVRRWQVNVTYNCLDRHVEAGLGDRVAFYYEGEPTGDDASARRSRTSSCSTRWSARPTG